VLRGLRPLSSFSSSQKSSAPQVRRGSRVTSEWPPPRLTRNRARSCYLPRARKQRKRSRATLVFRLVVFLLLVKRSRERERERERERDASLRAFRDILHSSVHAIHWQCRIRMSERQPSAKTINVTSARFRAFTTALCATDAPRRSSKSGATSRYARQAPGRVARDFGGARRVTISPGDHVCGIQV